MSKIILNIVEPGTDPTTIDPVVPNTGLFTHGIGGPEATIIVSAVLVLAIVGIIATCLYRKHKKAGKTTKLVNIINQTKAIVKNKKRITAGLMALALLVSAGTFTTLMANSNKGNTNAIEGEEGNLTVNVSDEDLTIEVGDAPVFAVLPVDITVEEATQAGYTLTAYADSTDLVSTTNPDNAIPMIAVEGDELEALTDNTYGLSLEEPTSKDEEAYTTLSTDQDNPTILKSMPDYIPTEAEDTTTIYYGFYITPDIPYGTYTNDSEVHYDATINTTLVTFDGNGLYFNNEEQQTITNEVEYIAVPQENNETETSSTINQIISGEYKEPSQDLPYNFLGWSTDDQATSPTYTSEQEIAESLPIKPNQPITLYAIWQKVTNIIFNSNDDTGTTSTQSIIAGQSTNLNPNTFTREGYNFTGWNTEATPTEQEPGTPYADEAEYTAPLNKSQNLILYAQWEEDGPIISDLTYMQDFATLSEEDKNSILNSMAEETTYTLKDRRDEQEYTVAKLKDGKIWMTKNLNLAGGSVITSDFSDIPENYVLPTANGFQEGNKLPSSSQSGFNVDSKAFVYNSPKITGTDCSSPGCYSYYSYVAATAGSKLDFRTSADASYSICPRGWRLPGETTSDYYQLDSAYKTASVSFYDEAGPDTVANFLAAGSYSYGKIKGQFTGFYTTSRSYFSSYYEGVFTRGLYFTNIRSNYIETQYLSDGYAIRCILR